MLYGLGGLAALGKTCPSPRLAKTYLIKVIYSSSEASWDPNERVLLKPAALPGSAAKVKLTHAVMSLDYFKLLHTAFNSCSQASLYFKC